jgi:uncharacterized membrane protein YphA (DoxX/SURF4 family)
MKKFLNSRWLNLVIRIFLGALFIYASLDKLLHPLEFARIVAGYRLLPDTLNVLVAAFLPLLELLIGLLLLCGIWTVPALLWVGALLFTFMGGIGQAYWRGLSIDCGCFSIADKEKDLGLKTLLRDSVLLLLWFQACWYYWKQSRRIERGVNHAV